MKRGTGFVLMFVLLIGWAVCAQADAADTASMYNDIAVIANPDPTDRLNLRTEPREDAVSLGKYYNGVSVQVYGVRNGWAEVSIAGRRGYMKDEYLAYGSAAAGVADAIPTMSVNADSVALRADASQSGKLLGRYAKGTSVEVLGVGTVWNHVRIEGNYGYMMAAYLDGDVTFHKDSGQIRAAVNNPNPADRLNLRTAPREDAVSLGKYYNGVTVWVSNVKNGWAEVSIAGRKGYMKNAFLAYGDAVTSIDSAVPTATVGVSSLNLRADTSQSSNLLGSYAKGTRVEILGVGTVWDHVCVEGNYGYMMAEYLDGGASFHKNSGTDESGTLYAAVNNPDPKDRLNLRATASEKATSLGKFYNCTPVKVLEKRSDGWCRVQIGEGEGLASGYMETKYLAFGTQIDQVQSALCMYEVTQSTALEATPGGPDDGICRVQAGEAVYVMGDIGDEYCFVYTGNISGYFPRWAISEKAIY